jgi:hypothetical protein
MISKRFSILSDRTKQKGKCVSCNGLSQRARLESLTAEKNKHSLAASPPQAGCEGGKKAVGVGALQLIKEATITDRQAQTVICLREALTTRALALRGRAGRLAWLHQLAAGANNAP